MISRTRAAAAVWLVACAPLVFACAPDGQGEQQALGKGLSVAYAWLPEPPAIGNLATLRIRICDDAGKPAQGKLTVDAVMPAHGHGMNYAPPRIEVAAGPVEVTGLLFHMPGRWQLRFKLRADGTTRRARADFVLSP